MLPPLQTPCDVVVVALQQLRRTSSFFLRPNHLREPYPAAGECGQFPPIPPPPWTVEGGSDRPWWYGPHFFPRAFATISFTPEWPFRPFLGRQIFDTPAFALLPQTKGREGRDTPGCAPCPCETMPSSPAVLFVCFRLCPCLAPSCVAGVC